MTIVEIILLIFAIFVFFLLSAEFRYFLALKRNSVVAKIITKNTYKNLYKYRFDFSWWASFIVKKEKIKSFDGLVLRGKIIENNKKKFAVVVHGYGAISSEMQQYAKMFYDFGLSVLCPDNRGHGESQGKHITMGYYDKFDVLSWIQLLNQKYDNPEIVVFGLSMGAATVCMLSGLDLPQNVKAIVSDCGYTSAYEIFKNIHKKSIVFGILPTMQFFDIYSKVRVGFRLKDADATRAVKKTKTPILFVHGDNDKFVDFYMQDVLYNSAPQNLRDKFVVSGAGHAESITKNPIGYKQKVKSFLEQFIEF